MKSFYMDYAAATPVDPRVFGAMRPYFDMKFGNPGSLHARGAEALAALDSARETVAHAIGEDFRNVVFTASATEANNLALRGVVRGYKDLGSGSRKKNSLTPNPHTLTPRIVVSAVEHDSVLETARDMEHAGEAEVVIIPVDKKGAVDLKKLEGALDERTALVSVMYVNNELGTVQPIAEIAEIVRRHKSPVNGYPLFHTDAAQAFLYYPCNLKELGVDLMTLSSQKIYGPKGAGALILGNRVQGLGSRKESSLIPSHYALAPILTGGGQEFNLRAGTENVPAIVGLGIAAGLAEKERSKNFTRTEKVRDVFVSELKRMIPGAEENARGDAPHIANIAFPEGISAEDLLVLFDRADIAASPGAACSARALTLSHVLRAIGISDERITRSIRFSFGRGITEKDARDAARVIGKIVTSLPVASGVTFSRKNRNI